MTQRESRGQLFKVIDTCPIIDNHAHRLHLYLYWLALDPRETHDNYPLVHVSSLPYLRAGRQIASLLGFGDTEADAEMSIRNLRNAQPEL